MYLYKSTRETFDIYQKESVIHTHTYTYIYIFTGGARGVMVIGGGNGHGSMSSNPGRDWLYFT